MKHFCILAFCFFLSCGQDIGSGSTVIIFADVVGTYEGECADYDDNATVLNNREEATLSLFAKSTDAAGINTSCDRFETYELKLKSADAGKIEFERDLGNNEVIRLVYLSEKDSITLTHTNINEKNLIFSGVRK